MQKVLIVVEDIRLAAAQIEKIQLLNPNQVHVVVFVRGDEPGHRDLKTNIKKMFRKGIRHTIELAEYSDIGDKLNIVGNVLRRDKTDLLVLGRSRQKDAFDLAAKKELFVNVHYGIFYVTKRLWKEKMRILCTVDCSEKNKQQQQLDTTVIGEAKGIADTCHARLHALSVIALSRLGQEFDVVDQGEVLEKKGKSTEKKLLAFLQKNGIEECVPHICAGIPADEIASAAKKHKADLVIMGNVGRKGIKGFIFGNTAEKALLRLGADVLMLKVNK